MHVGAADANGKRAVSHAGESLGSKVWGGLCVIGAGFPVWSRKSEEESGKIFLYLGFAAGKWVRYCVIGAGSGVKGLRSKMESAERWCIIGAGRRVESYQLRGVVRRLK